MRTIPIHLAGHLASGRTSLCLLTKVKCKDGTILAFTTLDAPVTYNDGGPDGPMVYSPLNGFTPSEMTFVSDLAVDNAEAAGWIRDAGITEQQVRAGIFDHARFWMYRVNYMDLSQGHWIAASGTTGETRFTESGFVVELRGKTQALKQPLAEVYTLTCPVAYGSAACGKTLEWASAVVDTPDATEPDRIFTYKDPDSGFLAAPAYNFGVIKVTSGDNAGAQVEVELHETGELTLLLPLPYPLAEDDEFDIRIDCNKVARDDVHGCKSELRWGAEWNRHHRGFPDIPVARQGSLTVPGAETPSVPGSGSVTTTAEE